MRITELIEALGSTSTAAHITREAHKLGHLHIDGNEIVGVASDGVEVSLGDVRELDSYRSFICQRPHRADW